MSDSQVADPQTAETQRHTLTVEERTHRIGEIKTRLGEMEGQFRGAVMPDDARDEWDSLADELTTHQRAIVESEERRERLKQLVGDGDASQRSTERVDGRHTGYTRAAPNIAPAKPDNIYDLADARSRARSIDELPGIYRDRAMRAVEIGQYPGISTARRGASRESAQQRAAELLDGVDNNKGDLARRILATGSPTYERAFFKAVIRGGTIGLTSEEQRALTMGTLASPGDASLPVPFTLDPTIILSSDGSLNPLRQMARVETITGKAWQGVTSAGVSVTRTAESGREAGDDAPTLTQPEVKPEAVHGFVPFTVESDEDWPQLRSEMTRLLNDAKETEEATSFTTGNGTAPNPEGIVAGLDAGRFANVSTATGITSDDIYGLEEALGERFLQRAQFLAARSTYNTIRQLDTQGGADLWARLGAMTPPELIGYPARKSSAVPAFTGTNRFVVFGDFQTGFLIVDKAGMGVELIPHLFATGNNRPSGQRGMYALWRNNSLVLVDEAFRGLVATA